MPPRPFANDGLWNCLCPSSSLQTSDRVLFRVGASLGQRNAAKKHGTTQNIGRRSRAYSSTSNAALSSTAPFFSQPGASSVSFPPTRIPRDKPPLAQLPTHILYEHVRAEGAKGHFDEVMNICRVLVKDRGEQPNKDMYTAVLHSFVSSSNGTVGKVRKVLEEMGFWNEASVGAPHKIELDTRGCECVLEVLAVHPDHLLRTEILEHMKSRWFPLSDRARNFVVAGMLRERHFEHALETLEDMVRNKARVESWLFDTAIWTLLEFGEVEEAFYVLTLREGVERSKVGGTGTVKLSDALWGALLDAAGQKQLVSHAFDTLPSPHSNLSLTVS
jgi:hypothetical protein